MHVCTVCVRGGMLHWSLLWVVGGMLPAYLFVAALLG